MVKNSDVCWQSVVGITPLPGLERFAVEAECNFGVNTVAEIDTMGMVFR